MELKDKYDVVIVGAGPAGAGAAKAISDSGMKTLIVERDKLPRYKMCSGIVFPSSRKFIETNFGNLPEEIMCMPKMIKGNRVFFDNDSDVMDVPFNAFDPGDDLDEEGFNTWRSDLDNWLCRQSDAVIVDDCRFDGYEMAGADYIVGLTHKGQKVSVKAKYLIGCDGTLSRVRRSAFPGFDEKIVQVPNYEEYYTGDIDLEPGWLYLFMDRRVTGYFATVFHKDDRIAVVTGVNQKESPKEYFKVFREHLEKRHGLVVKETAAKHAIVLQDMNAQKNYCMGKDNLLLAGEAGGFLRGGEGITSSLISGKAAGDAVLASSKNGKPALNFFKEFSAEEVAMGEKVAKDLEDVLGFNCFMRP